MSQLSVIIITLNEAGNIGACLDTVAFADEVIVVDSGSSDATVAIAQAKGAKVTVTTDWPGFGPQKSRALALATKPWVLSLDADERVPESLAREIQTAMAREDAVAYAIPRLTQFCGAWIRHCGWTPDYVLRLFRRGTARFSPDLVHEQVLVDAGSTQRLGSSLLHYSYPTPQTYWRKLEQYSRAWALQRHRQGQQTSMARAVFSGLFAFVRSYVARLGFLDGAMGFAVCVMQAQAAYGKYFELYCLNRQHERKTA